MLRNHLKIAFRNMRRHSGYASLNILGLTLGIGSALLILLYVQHELSFDRYHQQADRIYRLVNTGPNDADYAGIAKVNGPWGPTMRDEVPEVEDMTRFVFFGQALMEREDVRAYQPGGFFADSSVFDIFDFKFISGDPVSALSQPRSIVLTKSLSRVYFGDEDPVGREIHIDNASSNTMIGFYTVTGVLEDIAHNSHFTFRYLVSMGSYHHPDMNDWIVWNQFYTYVLLQEGVDAASVSDKFAAVLSQHLTADELETNIPYLQPLTSIHLQSALFREISVNGNATYVYIFAGIAFFILLIACINFINLSTARGVWRAKEIGIRKVSGAHRTALIWQFMSEAFLLTTFALASALFLAYSFLDGFNLLIGTQLDLAQMLEGKFLLGLVLLWISVSVVSGSYPALVLSRFKPAAAIKGNIKGGANQWMRKGLVVFQFAISAFLIIVTGVVLQQVSFIQHRNLGFTPEQLVTVPIRNDVFRSSADLVKNQLLSHTGVIDVAVSGNLPGGGDWGIPIRPEGIPEDEIPDTRIMAVDEDFIETFDMELVTGNGFSKERPAENAIGYLMNEEAVRQYGWQDPLGKSIAMPAIGREAGPILGVVKDFHFRSMQEKIGPLVFFRPPDSWFSIYSIRVSHDQLTEALAHIEETWNTFDPEHPFTYSFLDQQYGALHSAEQRTGDILTRFAFLAILISCIGLFGLTTFSVTQRTKEIGVRKVIGATIVQITWLLTKDLTGMVCLGLAVAIPTALLATNQWLASFAYRISLGWEVVAIAGVLILLITILTVGFHTVRAGMTNPVDALRYE